MIVNYTKQFVIDIENYPLSKKKILDVIESLKEAETLSEIRNIKKLKAPGNNYRLRIQCRLVSETGFDFAQPDSHPERSRRVYNWHFLRR